jgi:ribonuclease VapC
MNSLVFDSSAILAIYYNEPGKKKVRSLLDSSEPLISSVNLCEVFTKLLEDGLHGDAIVESFNALEIEVVDFNVDHALKAAELRSVTRHLGLSLGDRACIALAIHEKTAAVTADKSWAELSVCKIEVIG